MLRFLTRAVGVILIAGGFAALIIDGTRSIAATRLMLTSFGATCAALFPKSFPLLQPAVEARLHPLVWSPVLETLFALPSALVLTLLGLLLFWLARPRRAPIGYSSRP